VESLENLVKSNIYKVKAEVTKTMIDDLADQLGFDIIQKIESLLVIKAIRKSKIEKILSKI